MKVKKAIIILENHNEWRRNEEVPNTIVMVDPKELGIAIDTVVSEFKNNVVLPDVINWAYFPEDKPSYGDEILIQYPPEQMTAKTVTIYDRETELIDGCKYLVITLCL